MAFTKEFELILITLSMYLMCVRSEISMTVTDNGFNYVSLLEYGDFLNGKQLMFKVKAHRDAHVKLVSLTSSFIIMIGGWNNGRSAIKKLGETGNEIPVNHFEYKILNSRVYLKFWISWRNGLIRVGKGDIVDQGIFMEREDQCFYALTDIVILTVWGGTATWLIQPPAKRVSKNGQLGKAMFQEIRNCPSSQLLNTFTTSDKIKCSVLCLKTSDCKMFRVVKNKGECELLSDEAGKNTFPSVYRKRD